MKTIYRDFIICIVSLTILHPHFVHPHFIIRIYPSAFYHPHFPIRILSSAFFYPPSAIRRHPSALYRDPLSPVSFTRKLLCLFCREKFCTKTVYSGIELICEFAKHRFYHNQNPVFASFLLFLLVWLVCKSF